MKRLTAVLALVTVMGLMIATSAPASAAPRTTTSPSVTSVLDRILALIGMGAPATPATGHGPKTGGSAPVTVSPEGAIWGCRGYGIC